MTKRGSIPTFLGVTAAHVLLLAAFIHRSGDIEPPVKLPDLQGVLVSNTETPPAVELTAPSAPPPKQAPAPASVPAPPSTPLPPVSAPPSERALTAPPPSPRVEQRAQPVQEPQSQVAETKTAPTVERTPAAPRQEQARAARPAEDGGTVPVVQPRVDAGGYLSNPKPKYPAVSRRLGEHGRVLLDVLVLVDGSVGNIAVKTSSGYPRLDSAALDAVRRWHFQPARRGTSPIAYQYLVPIDFRIGG